MHGNLAECNKWGTNHCILLSCGLRRMYKTWAIKNSMMLHKLDKTPSVSRQLEPTIPKSTYISIACEHGEGIIILTIDKSNFYCCDNSQQMSQILKWTPVCMSSMKSIYTPSASNYSSLWHSTKSNLSYILIVWPSVYEKKKHQHL